MDLTGYSDEQLKQIAQMVATEQQQRRTGDMLKRLLSNKDFLKSLLSSNEFSEFCKELGFDIHSDDIVDVALPALLKFFGGDSK